MGSVMKGLFGGSDAQQSSGNVNNTALMGSLNPATGYVTQSGDLLNSLLSGNTDALNKFSNSGGMQFLEQQGDNAITSNKAASGLLKSGSYGTALENYNQNVAHTYMNDYLDKVNNLGTLGLGAAGVLANSGDTSSGTTSEKKGIIPGIAGLISANHSDRRIKKDIEKIGEYVDGLGKYRWTYLAGFGPTGRVEGVMADEVQKLRPWAYIPDMGDGYAGVNYSLLGR